MISLPAGSRIWLVAGITDMRNGFNGLASKGKRLVRTVLIFTESSDQLSRATDRVPGLPASPEYAQ
ncbi:transposase [Escherichia coli]|nr:transposase [Escherichia coli]SQR15350.1 transposase [Escherichia coli]